RVSRAAPRRETTWDVTGGRGTRGGGRATRRPRDPMGARPDGLASLRRRVPAGARAGPAARRLGRGPSRVAAAYSPGVERGSRSSGVAVAGWYDARVGVRGSPHHRKAAVPTVMRLADRRRGERVIGVGCGTGVLAFHVAKAGAESLGVDASAQMIRLARRRR